MITLTKEKLANAIKRAKQIRPRVTWLGGRSFTVSGSTGNTYTVHFAVARDAQQKQVCLGICNCEAGQREMICFHLAAAAAVNMAIHAMRWANVSPMTAATVKPEPLKEVTEAPAPKAAPKHYGQTLEAMQI